MWKGTSEPILILYSAVETMIRKKPRMFGTLGIRISRHFVTGKLA
jgi:hypothetical protein